MINFSSSGIIQVRNGDSFISSAVPYTAGETLQFRLVENLPATTYSLFVTPPGAAEVPLATDLQVPSDQRGAKTLGGWGQLVNAPDGATLAVCDFSLQ
jgi:unsaturated chondroitin disaccharide hydrolase